MLDKNGKFPEISFLMFSKNIDSYKKAMLRLRGLTNKWKRSG